MKKLILPLLVCLAQLCGAQTNDLIRNFDQLLSSFKPNEPGGLVLIAKQGKITYQKAFGSANLEYDIPMKPEIVFNIASITKQFTAVGILQLVEQGKLSLQDSLTKFFPRWPLNGQKVTIENLLTHTAGIPNSPPEKLIALQGRRGNVNPSDVIATFENLPLEFAPGTRWRYSNNGYILLGMIIEKVAGMPYGEYLAKYIFEPAGMVHSFYGDDYLIVKNRAASYLYWNNKYSNANNGKIDLAYAAGGIQSTIADLYQWNRALLSGKLIGREMLKKAFTEYKLANGKGTGYGYGWFVGNIQGSKVVEHGGNHGGFMTHYNYLPAEDIFVAVFYNFRGKLPEILSTDMAAMLIGKPFEMKEVELKDEDLQPYIGVYETEDGSTGYVTLAQHALYYQSKGGNKFKMVPYGKETFIFDNTVSTAVFKKDTSQYVLEIGNKRNSNKTILKKTDKPLP